LTLAYSRTGDLLSWYAHQHAESLAMHQKSLGVLGSLLAEDPFNTDLGHIHAWEILRTGDENSDPKAAAGSFREALGELQALSTADANDAQVQVEVAIAISRLGSSFLQQGNAKSALAEFEKSLADCRRLARPGVANADLAWATASDQFQIGKAHEALAADAKQPSSMRAEQWKQAQSWYQQSIPAIRQSLNSTYGDLAQDALQQAQAGLARCEQELGKVAANR
jgi:hypothetical protein